MQIAVSKASTFANSLFYNKYKYSFKFRHSLKKKKIHIKEEKKTVFHKSKDRPIKLALRFVELDMGPIVLDILGHSLQDGLPSSSYWTCHLEKEKKKKERNQRTWHMPFVIHLC